MLLEMDLAKAREFLLKWNGQRIEDDFVLTASLHKARTGCLGLPREARQLSKDWLTKHGLHSLDDGDLV